MLKLSASLLGGSLMMLSVAPAAENSGKTEGTRQVTFSKDVTTIFDNDGGNELGLGAGKDQDYIESYQGKLIDAKGVKGRYVRLYSNGNTTDKLNHYIEVEVFGKPAA